MSQFHGKRYYKHITLELAHDAQAPEREKENPHMSTYRFEATVTITPEERKDIETAMSKAMGEHIMAIGQTDFAKWGKDDWLRLVAIAFGECAPRVLQKRVTISRPFNALEDDLNDEVPF